MFADFSLSYSKYLTTRHSASPVCTQAILSHRRIKEYVKKKSSKTNKWVLTVRERKVDVSGSVPLLQTKDGLQSTGVGMYHSWWLRNWVTTYKLELPCWSQQENELPHTQCFTWKWECGGRMTNQKPSRRIIAQIILRQVLWHYKNNQGCVMKVAPQCITSLERKKKPYQLVWRKTIYIENSCQSPVKFVGFLNLLCLFLYYHLCIYLPVSLSVYLSVYLFIWVGSFTASMCT